MKIVNLCSCGSCCPVVRVTNEKVVIGEAGNVCELTLEQWNILKREIYS